MLNGASKCMQDIQLDTAMYIEQVDMVLGWRPHGFEHTSYFRTHARGGCGRLSITLRRAW